MGGIVILASCMHYRVRENMVQHPSINISIVRILVLFPDYTLIEIDNRVKVEKTAPDNTR